MNFHPSPTPRFLLPLLAAAALAPGLRASMPAVGNVEPWGGQRGTEMEWTLRGERLENPQTVHFYQPGIEVLEIRNGSETGKVVVAKLRIAPDVKPGPIPFRLRTARGFSTVRPFFVGPYPTVKEAEPNSFFDAPQAVVLDSTVEGVARNEDVDYYRVEAKKGERVSVEVEAMRIGRRVFDPYVAILATNRFELAFCDDSTLLKQDAFASIVAPYDGAYIVEVRETSYAGGDDANYRLHIGRFTRPTMVTPPVVKPGEAATLTFLGDPAGPFQQQVQAQAAPGYMDVWAERDGTIAPSPNRIRVSPLPAYAETEPNDNRGAVTNVVGAVPGILTGVIGQDGDNDWIRFRATKGQVFQVETYARRLRSPFDAVVSIFSTGKEPKRLEGGDDKDGPDPSFRWTVPEDGEYLLYVKDHLREGGPDCVYQVAFEPVEPELSLYLPEFKTRTQQRYAVSIPRGGKWAGLIKIGRENVGGDNVIEWPALPEGVTLTMPPVPGSLDLVPVMLSAATNAPLSGALLPLTVRMADTNNHTRGGFAMTVPLVYGDPNNAVYSSVKVDKLAVGVVDPVPFRVWIEQPAVPVVHGGNLSLVVRCERQPGFDAPIKVRILQNPPSVTSPNEITIGKTQSNQNYRVTCSGGEARTWPVAVIAAAEQPEEQTWTASDFVNLEVATPFVAGEIPMAAAEIGKPVDVVCKLAHHKPFQGEARIELVGLPAGCKAEPRTFTNNQAQVVFNVSVAPDAPQGQHKSLFCSVDIPQNGAFIQHSIAATATLRIDPPPPAPPPQVAQEKKPDAPAAAPPPPAANAPVLSRLEKLRLQAKGQKPGGS